MPSRVYEPIASNLNAETSDFDYHGMQEAVLAAYESPREAKFTDDRDTIEDLEKARKLVERMSRELDVNDETTFFHLIPDLRLSCAFVTNPHLYYLLLTEAYTLHYQDLGLPGNEQAVLQAVKDAVAHEMGHHAPLIGPGLKIYYGVEFLVDNGKRAIRPIVMFEGGVTLGDYREAIFGPGVENLSATDKIQSIL